MMSIVILTGEIRKMKGEIDRNLSAYIDIRSREKGLEELTSEMETEINRMVKSIYESIQPFYIIMSKVETTVRKPDKNHDKVLQRCKLI